METEIDSSEGSLPGAEDAKQVVGSQLKAERERQGFTEKQVADRLHITMHYVRALETDDYERLPGVVFARGYIKSYALLLGLDKDDLVAQFDAMVEERTPPQSRTFIKPGRRGKKQTQAVIWLLIAALAFLAAFLVFWSYNRFFATDQDQVAEFAAGRTAATATADNAGSLPMRGVVLRAEPTLPVTEERGLASPQRTTSTIRQVEQWLPVRLGSDNSLISRGKSRLSVTEVFTLGADLLQVNFRTEGWIEISGADAESIYRELHRQGDVLRITGRAPFNVLLGDAGSVTIKLNQLDVPVTENIRIDNTARLLVGI